MTRYYKANLLKNGEAAPTIAKEMLAHMKKNQSPYNRKGYTQRNLQEFQKLGVNDRAPHQLKSDTRKAYALLLTIGITGAGYSIGYGVTGKTNPADWVRSNNEPSVNDQPHDTPAS